MEATPHELPPPSSFLPTSEDKNKKRKNRIIGKGRKRIEIKKIENKKKLEICFSKRYRGFLSMVEELSTLCGVDVAAIVFSPTSKAYSFANPSVEQLIAKLPCINISHAAAVLMEKFKDDDGDDEKEVNGKYNDVMVQEKMEELRGIMSLSTNNDSSISASVDDKHDDHHSLAPSVFNPFLAAIGDLHLVLGSSTTP